MLPLDFRHQQTRLLECSRMELEQDLGELDDSESSSLPLEERKVSTQPLDLSVQTLVEQWTLDVLVLPEIQRQYVWDDGKASRLVESLLLKIPIPGLYFAETEEAKFEIIDGHQRVRSIARYMSNEFALRGLPFLKEFNTCRFHQLPPREQRFLKMRTLRAVVIGVESHPSMKFEIFERLNTGAISLNAQELRNSTYRGALNRALREIAREESFRILIGTKQPRKRMVDEELVLRFLALSEGLESYRPSLKRFLNKFMERHRHDGPAYIEQAMQEFRLTAERAVSLFGRSAFRIIGSDGVPVERSVNRALYDAEMLACRWLTGDSMNDGSTILFDAVGDLCKDNDFLDAIGRATGDRSRTLTRVRMMVQAFKDAGLAVDEPGFLE